MSYPQIVLTIIYAISIAVAALGSMVGFADSSIYGDLDEWWVKYRFALAAYAVGNLVLVLPAIVMIAS